MTYEESDHPIWHRNDVVKHYDQRFHKLFEAEIFIFNKYLNNEMQVLDLACGAGRVSQYLRNKVKYIKGIDISSEMVEAYKKNVPGIDVECSSLLDLTEEDESYDAILIPYNSLDYILPEKSRNMVLRKIHRILRPNGLLIFSGHNTCGAGIILYAPRPRALLTEIARFIRGDYFKDKAISYSAVWGEKLKHFRAAPEYIIHELSDYGFQLLELRGGNMNRRSRFVNKYLETWIYYVFKKN